MSYSVPDHLPVDLDISEGDICFIRSGSLYPMTYIGPGVAEELGEFAYEDDKGIQTLNLPYPAVRKATEDEI